MQTFHQSNTPNYTIDIKHNFTELTSDMSVQNVNKDQPCSKFYIFLFIYILQNIIIPFISIMSNYAHGIIDV